MATRTRVGGAALRLFVLICLPLVVFVSCSGGSRTDGNENEGTHVLLQLPPDPLQSPFPNDLFRDPETGENALSLTDSSSLDPLIEQVNELDGFSVSAPLRIPFSGPLDETSVDAESVIVLEMEDPSATPAMKFSVEPDSSGNPSWITALPLRPLVPGRTYVVVVTRNVHDASGDPVEAGPHGPYLREETSLIDAGGRSLHKGLSDESARLLEPVRRSLQPAWEAAEAFTGESRDRIPFAFTFTTQPLFDMLDRLWEQAQEEHPEPEIYFGVAGASSIDLLFQLFGADFVPHDHIHAVYLGRFEAPQYIQDPLTGPFVFSQDGAVVEAFREDLEFIAALPEGDGPFPVMIFAHGITRSKEDLLAIADAACSRGTAVIGIDLVLHGSRTKDLDRVNNETGEPVPDGIADPSGANFINMENLLVSRDNVRQSVADLFALTHMIRNGASDFDADGFPELSSDRVAFVGMSLGGIVGVPYVAMERGLDSAVINAAGGRLLYLLDDSDSVGPQLRQSVAYLGIEPGTPEYRWLLAAGQIICDDADAFVYGARFAAGDSTDPTGGILLQEMIGDLVVPNSATVDLARALSIMQVDLVDPVEGLDATSSPFTGTGLYQYDDGGHRALLDVTDGPTEIIQAQVMTYLQTAFDGAGPTIVDPYTLQGAGAPSAIRRPFPDFLEGRRRLGLGVGGGDTGAVQP